MSLAWNEQSVDEGGGCTEGRVFPTLWAWRYHKGRWRLIVRVLLVLFACAGVCALGHGDDLVSKAENMSMLTPNLVNCNTRLI